MSLTWYTDCNEKPQQKLNDHSKQKALDMTSNNILRYVIKCFLCQFLITLCVMVSIKLLSQINLTQISFWINLSCSSHSFLLSSINPSRTDVNVFTSSQTIYLKKTFLNFFTILSQENLLLNSQSININKPIQPLCLSKQFWKCSCPTSCLF